MLLTAVATRLVGGAMITAVPPSDSLGDKVLATDVELLAATNQFGAITLTHYSGACDCSNKKACDEPPDYKHWDSSRPDFYDRTLEEQTTARLGAMMLLSRGCYDPKKDDGPGNACPLKYTMMLDAIKRAGQENVTKIGLFDDNNDGWAQIRNHHKGLPHDTPFDFSDKSSWKYVFDNNYKVFFELIPSHMWYRVDGKPVIAMWIFSKEHYPKGRLHIGAFMQWLKTEFKQSFGVEPALVPPTSIFDDGSSAKKADVYCAHKWFSAARDVLFSVVNEEGMEQCGAMVPGYRDKCTVPPCKDCRECKREDGARLDEGLRANQDSKFALIEGWNDVHENAGSYRSKAWSTPSLYVNTIRKHADPSPLTLRLQAETADRFSDTTAENMGGEYREDGLDVGKLGASEMAHARAIQATPNTCDQSAPRMPYLPVRTRAIDGPNGGWYVGWTEPGEWIEFPGIQLGCGIHRFTARCSSDGEGRVIRLDLPTLNSTAIPKTGLDSYQYVHLGEVHHGGGQLDLRLVFESGGVNMDWLFVKKVSSCSKLLLDEAAVESARGDGTIYMIRHGEKDSKGCESTKGMERANALHSIFKSKFQLPDFIYAYHYTHDCQRTTQTITPLAKSLGLTVDTHHGSDSDAAVKAFVSRLSSDKVIVACWEHNHILKVAQSFGVAPSKIPSWSGRDYDTVFVFTIKSGKLVDFKVSHEGFHPQLDSSGDEVAGDGDEVAGEAELAEARK